MSQNRSQTSHCGIIIVGQSGSRQIFLDVYKYFYISVVLPKLPGHSCIYLSIFISIQFGPEAHLLSCITGTCLSRGVALSAHPFLAPRLKKVYSYSSISHSVFSWHVIRRPLLRPDHNKEWNWRVIVVEGRDYRSRNSVRLGNICFKN